MQRSWPLLLVLILLATPLAAHHGAPSGAEEVEVLEAPGSGPTWRAVAFAPDGSHALLAGRAESEAGVRDVLARYTPEGGLEVLFDRPGSGLADVAFHPNGTSLVVGIRNTLLLGSPGAYRNIWNESRFAATPGLSFFGLRAAFQPGTDRALVAGSSLLTASLSGEIEVLHGGRGAFFRSVAWNPSAPFGWVEAAVERDGRALLGAVWRTDGESPLDQEDNVAIYGRLNPGSSLLNTISFAPNGSYALLAGRDGAGASLLTWSSHRTDCHRHERGACHDHRWQYLPTSKAEGPVTCAAFHPTGQYALVAGLDRNVLGYADTHVYAPLQHQGPDLFGCAFHPSGAYALVVGADGAVLEVTPGLGPLAAVATPGPGALVPPKENATFLVGTLARSENALTVTASIAGVEANVSAVQDGAWWRVLVDTTGLTDGTYELLVEAAGPDGQTTLTHPFLVNNEQFTPARPRVLEPTGLEGQGVDADGRFTVRWGALDAPVVYEVQEQVAGESNATRVLPAGARDNLTVQVDRDGQFLYRVRSVNAFNTSAWSESVVVNVVLDSDQDGVPDSRDPRPFLADVWGDTDEDGVTDDVEYAQCSDPTDANSTPSSDDDGDGVPNGVECSQGSDARDPDDPVPREDVNGPDEPNGDPGGNGSPGPGTLLVLALLAFAARRMRRPR